MTEFKPIPDPAGALEPPRRFPPTAVGAATPPEPEREGGPAIAGRVRRRRSSAAVALKLAVGMVGLPLLGLVQGVRALRRLAQRG